MPGPPADHVGFNISAHQHIDMRAAALLMSGQRGGGIDGVLMVGAPEQMDGTLYAPFWIELGGPPPGGTVGPLQWTFEVFVYALDKELEVNAFEGRTLRLDLGADEPQPGGGGVRLHGRIEMSPTARILRVLVRDRGRGEFYLDEKTVPLSPEGAGDAEAFIVFPDTEEGWTEIGSAAWNFDPAYVEGFEIGGARYVPRGRPVIAAPSGLDFFVVATLPEGDISTIGASLRNDLGREVGAGDLAVVHRLPTATEGQVAHAVTWRVPDLDPGRYLLELSLSGESGDPMAAEISVIAVAPATASEHPTWVTFADAPSRPVMPRTSAAELIYLDALGLCASGRWNECVAGVFEMEGRAIRDSGGANPPAGLFTLEGSGIASLAEHTPSSMIPLLALHHDVFRAWIAADGSVGQKHSVRLIAAMANDIRNRPALAPATSTAVAVLASIGDTLYRRGALDSAIDVLELALTLDPVHQASLLGTAADHEWLGHYQETVEVLHDLGNRPDALFEGRLRLGVNLLRIGERRDAITELQACTDRGAPAWVRAVAYEELALYDLDNGRPEQAKALIEEATAVLPEETTLQLMSAYIEEARGNLGEARRVLTRLDQKALSSYRESPRKRYARWPSEVFAEQRRGIEELATEHLGDLAAALAAQPDTRGP
jgi:tetratricopeptide (TPR) repeat protein